MEKRVLSDANIYPSENVIFSHLGKVKASFSSFMDYNHSAHPDFVESWRYYNDGKSWLLNVAKKKKTVFWLSVGDGFFRATFYMNSKAEQSIIDSKIPEPLKKQYLETAGKKFRPISLVIKTKKDIEIYRGLLELKLSNS
jgi:hypothetical protein